MGITRAIIIGISKYSRAADYLPCARPSAELLRATLAKHYAFGHITSLYDHEATLAGITKALSSLETLGPADAALIAFCGHVKKMGDRCYFVPQDSSLEDTHHRMFLPEYELFIEYMEKIRAGHIFLIIDACYGGLLLQRRGITNDIAEPDEVVAKELMSPDKPSRFAMTAGDASEPVLDGGGSNVSIFMEEMCDYLNTFRGKVIPATTLASEVKYRVLQRLQHGVVKQHPLAGHLGRELGGIFCFVSNKTVKKHKQAKGKILKRGMSKEKDVTWFHTIRLPLNLHKEIHNIEYDIETCNGRSSDDLDLCRKIMTELRMGQFDAYCQALKKNSSEYKIMMNLRGIFDAYYHGSKKSRSKAFKSIMELRRKELVKYYQELKKNRFKEYKLVYEPNSLRTYAITAIYMVLGWVCTLIRQGKRLD